MNTIGQEMLQLPPVHVTLYMPPESSLPEWIKILATAIISSFFTAALTEPLKLWVSEHLHKRRILKSLLWEASRNYSQLQNILDVHKTRTYMDEREKDRFLCDCAREAIIIKRYEAVRESPLFFELPEADWITDYYSKLSRLSEPVASNATALSPVDCVDSFITQLLAAFIETALKYPNARKILIKAGTPLVKRRLKEFEPANRIKTRRRS